MVKGVEDLRTRLTCAHTHAARCCTHALPLPLAPLAVLSGRIRDTVIVNLDPGNDHLPYPCAVDLMELITLEDVMESHQLGPNGGLMYCMEYLELHMDWLKEQIETKCRGRCPLRFALAPPPHTPFLPPSLPLSLPPTLPPPFPSFRSLII